MRRVLFEFHCADRSVVAADLAVEQFGYWLIQTKSQRLIDFRFFVFYSEFKIYLFALFSIEITRHFFP